MLAWGVRIGLGVVFGALLVRVAVGIYNRLAASPAEPQPLAPPRWGAALTIAVLMIVFQLLIGLLFGLILEYGEELFSARLPEGVRFVLGGLGAIVVNAYVLRWRLETTWRRGLLVSLTITGFIASIFAFGIVAGMAA